MKKVMSILMLAMFVCAIPFTFVGCKSTGSKIIGTWVYEKTKIFYSSTDIREEVEEWGYQKIVFNKDKTARVYYYEKGNIYTYIRNWVIGKDNKILVYEIEEDGYVSTEVFRLENGKLINGYKSDNKGYQDIFVKK